MSQRPYLGGIFLALFFCSGATALVYEVVWSKYLSQMFGSTIQAQTVVLAVFMGGLALGNRLLGRWADGLRNPIKAYGIIEFAIGLYAFAFYVLYAGADKLFVHWGASMLEHSRQLMIFKASLSVVLLAVPTVLMGGTLPLMAAWLNRYATDGGRRSARFYSVNSLGAVAGAGFAGFYLVQTFGLVATLQLTALVNLLVGAAAIGLSKTSKHAIVDSGDPYASLGSGFTQARMGWAGALVAFTGAVSMGLEVLAARSLALIFGSSLQSFAIVLMAFILGIGLGGAAMASPRIRHWRCETAVVILLSAASVWISVLVLNIESWVEAYRLVRSGLAQSTSGYTLHTLFAGAMAMVVLGVPAAFIGAVLPLSMRAVSMTAADLGERVGRLLTWNTLGAVVGVLLTGFVLMPQFGLRASFGIMAAVLALLACLMSWQGRFPRGWCFGGTGLLLAVALIAFEGDSWRHVLSSGVFRAREKEVDFSVMDRRRQHITIDFYEDAADATVSVERGDGVGAPAETGLRINGKTDASSHGDLGAQYLIAHLPMAVRPESKDVFILGLGSGITAGAVTGHPVERLVVAENCEPVIRAAELFAPWNRNVLTNDRVRVWTEDARTVLKLSKDTYDVIVTQPSNPWTAGIGSVFSREFYELAGSRLKEGGILTQWFQVYEMHDGIVMMVLRTFGSVFPHMEIWDCGHGDIVLLGSFKPWVSNAERYAAIFEREEPKADLARLGIRSPAALWARQLASQQTAFAIAGDGPIQSDAFPLLEYEAPRAFYIGINATVLRRFDERAEQWESCPDPKRLALQALTVDELKEQYRVMSTINADLAKGLEWEFRGQAFPPPPATVFSTASLQAAAAPPTVSEDLPEEIQRLQTAHAWIRTDRRLEGAAKIAELLERRTADSDWSPGYYAALAVKASLAESDAPQARRILKVALPLAPADDQLLYLNRIVERIAN